MTNKTAEIADIISLLMTELGASVTSVSSALKERPNIGLLEDEVYNRIAAYVLTATSMYRRQKINIINKELYNKVKGDTNALQTNIANELELMLNYLSTVVHKPFFSKHDEYLGLLTESLTETICPWSPDFISLFCLMIIFDVPDDSSIYRDLLPPIAELIIFLIDSHLNEES